MNEKAHASKQWADAVVAYHLDREKVNFVEPLLVI